MFSLLTWYEGGSDVFMEYRDILSYSYRVSTMYDLTTDTLALEV